jgi:hypothetical protein
MPTRLQRKVAVGSERASATLPDSDRWAWTVIFTSAALSALSLAVLFSVGGG